MKPANISASLNVLQKSEASSNSNVLNVISKLSSNAGINLSLSPAQKAEKSIENANKALSSLTAAVKNPKNSGQSAVVKALSEKAKPKSVATNPTNSLIASKIGALKNPDEVNNSKRDDKNNSSSKIVNALKSPRSKSAEQVINSKTEKLNNEVSKVVKTARSEQQKIAAVVNSKF